MRTCLLVALLIVAVTPAHSETSMTLAQAFAVAWQRQPAAQALAERERAAQSRRQAADAWSPEPPSIELGTRSDRFNNNRGAQEQELGLIVPLWLPGERGGAQALADAEGSAVNQRAAALRLQLAGEVRQAWWAWQLARNEQSLAALRVASATTLRGDVARRVAAGDLSRADQHQAEGALATAQALAAETEAATESAHFRLHSLVGMALGDASLAAEPAVAQALEHDALANHPALRDLETRSLVAQRSFDLTRARNRANPEVALSTRRERAVSGDEMDQTWALSLRIPFSSGARNDARLAEANADLIESRSQYEFDRERLARQLASARSQRDAARSLLGAAETRARLAAENRGFFDKSFRLGESDLPTRLRIELEAFEAERQAARARINLAQQHSAYRQALGLLPE
ncbi:MAG: TolC family protein [Rhodocyclaceae bacterium]|nr:TolC family protein [Rhodocyclaceae bacterium]